MNGQISRIIWIYFFANTIDEGMRCSGGYFHIHVPVRSDQPQTRSGSSVSALLCGPGETPGNRLMTFAEVVLDVGRVCPPGPDDF